MQIVNILAICLLFVSLIVAHPSGTPTSGQDARAGIDKHLNGHLFVKRADRDSDVEESPADATGVDQKEPETNPDDTQTNNIQSKNTIEWIGTPRRVIERGPDKIVSSTFESEAGKEVTAEVVIPHTYEVRSTLKVPVDDLLTIVELPSDLNITRAPKEATKIYYSMDLIPHSRGAVKFSDDIVKVSGKVKRIYNKGGFCTSNCDDKITEGEVEFRLTRTNAMGKPLGTFSTEYYGASKFKHPNFYNIDARDYQHNDAFPIAHIRSAYYCGVEAIRHDKHLAVYHAESMTCYLKEVVQGAGKTYNKWGALVGLFNAPQHDKEETLIAEVKEGWKKTRECDVIFSGTDGRHVCKVFPAKTGGAVLMFRYTVSPQESI